MGSGGVEVVVLWVVLYGILHPNAGGGWWGCGCVSERASATKVLTVACIKPSPRLVARVHLAQMDKPRVGTLSRRKTLRIGRRRDQLRHLVLFAACLFPFPAHYCKIQLGSIRPFLMNDPALNLTAVTFASFVSAQQAANMVSTANTRCRISHCSGLTRSTKLHPSPQIFPLLGGPALDRYNHATVIIVFLTVVLLGQVVFTLGVEDGTVATVVGGRVLFGIGESLVPVAQNVVIAKWFDERQLAFAMGCTGIAHNLAALLSAGLSASVICSDMAAEMAKEMASSSAAACRLLNTTATSDTSATAAAAGSDRWTLWAPDEIQCPGVGADCSSIATTVFGVYRSTLWLSVVWCALTVVVAGGYLLLTRVVTGDVSFLDPVQHRAKAVKAAAALTRDSGAQAGRPNGNGPAAAGSHTEEGGEEVPQEKLPPIPAPGNQPGCVRRVWSYLCDLPPMFWSMTGLHVFFSASQAIFASISVSYITSRFHTSPSVSGENVAVVSAVSLTTPTFATLTAVLCRGTRSGS